MSSGVSGGITSSAPHQSSGVAATSVQGSAAPGAAQGQNAGGVVDFPLPGQKGAPKKFKGKHSEVLTFLHFYERLCSKHHVVDDDDKVESITQYCSRSVRKFMEALPSYVKKDWSAFVADIKKYYEADKDQRRFKMRDLEKLVKHSRSRSMNTMAAWIKYGRDFIRVAGWLKSHQNISEFDYNYYFWVGIPESLRSRIESRIMSQKPSHDLANPFDADDVSRAAESLLQRNRFDRDRLLSEPENSHSESETTSSGSDSEDDSDWESSSYRKKKKEKKKKKKEKKEYAEKKKTKKRVTFKEVDSDETDSEEEAPTPVIRHKRTPPPTPPPVASFPRDDPDIEELIKQLEKMQVDDPAYAVIYFRAVNRNPLVKECVAPPVDRRRSTTPPPRTYGRDTPPHMTGGVGTPIGPGERRCYGCGGMGHTMMTCAALQEYFDKGVIIRDDRQRIILKNGGLIFRKQNEDWVSAIKRSTSPQTNFVALNSIGRLNESEYSELGMSYAQYYGYCTSEDTDEDERCQTYPVTRPEKTRDTRKEQFDGVWIPSR